MGETTPEDFMDEARQNAAQCWCDEETKDRLMDPVLCESVARRIAAWMSEAARFSRNEDFYRGLIDQCAKHLGTEAYTADDGEVHQDPIRLKVPELVAKLADPAPPRAEPEAVRKAAKVYAEYRDLKARSDWSNWPTATSERIEAMETLADAYLALRSAPPVPRDAVSDDEPVTEEWLRSVGFKENDCHNGYDSPMTTNGTHLHIHERSLFLCRGREGELDAEYFRHMDRKDTTRGHVRRLCEALGIPLARDAKAGG